MLSRSLASRSSAGRSGLVNASRVLRGAGSHYQGPRVPGHFRYLSKLPKVPASYGSHDINGPTSQLCTETKEVVFPFRSAYNEAYMLPFWIEFGNWTMILCTLWGSMFYYNYKFLGKNPPNPPRSKADDYAHRPLVHPHAAEEDD
ncbi:unnamed protein product [Amoebophrya sp. A120]|nr:unnamed protein product [Amoebophrya sp. A120]|eukprot:GSA120T00006020001.1